MASCLTALIISEFQYHADFEVDPSSLRHICISPCCVTGNLSLLTKRQRSMRRVSQKQYPASNKVFLIRLLVQWSSRIYNEGKRQNKPSSFLSPPQNTNKFLLSCANTGRVKLHPRQHNQKQSSAHACLGVATTMQRGMGQLAWCVPERDSRGCGVSSQSTMPLSILATLVSGPPLSTGKLRSGPRRDQIFRGGVGEVSEFAARFYKLIRNWSYNLCSVSTFRIFPSSWIAPCNWGHNVAKISNI